MSRGRRLRAIAGLVQLALSSGCAYTWGIEHAPLLSGPGPGSHWIHVNGGSAVYDVDLHLPKRRQIPATPVPLVIVLHGSGGTGPGMERRTMLSRLADSAGFAVAYPNAQKNEQKRRLWTGSSASSPDMKMLMALVDSINAKAPVDHRAVYLAGFSNGGSITYRAAIALPNEFAAIGVVAGSLNEGPAGRATTPSVGARAIPLVAVHGMLDDNVSFDASSQGGRRGSSAPGSVHAWALRNGCRDAPSVDTLLAGEAIRTTYRSCPGGATATLYAMVHGGHGWPNAGTREAPLETSDVLWRFFAEHRANDSLVPADRRP